jgi:5'-nucleotidase/UDP-sugar diphosphatase
MYRPLLSLLCLLAVWPASGQTKIRILHANDTHARLESTLVQGKPLGGWGRLASAISRHRADDRPTFLLHGGDAFQGTMFFNVYEGLADAAIMNLIGFDAMAVGNHEFDKGPETLAKFVALAQFPCVAANLDFEAEPALRGKVPPRAVLESKGVKIGVVGACTEDLPIISSPGPSVKMLPMVPSLQAQIDALEAEGVQIIVVLSHCGYNVEQGLAKALRGVDVVVGGHSHSLLGDPVIPGGPPSAGPYPTVVKNASGDTALVVQAWEWGKVLGKLDVEFDADGRVQSWEGSEPVAVDESYPEHPVVASMVEAFKKPIAEAMARVVGETRVMLARSTEGGESPMGNLIADSMLAATRKEGAVAAFMNAGGVRASLEPGPVTYGAAVGVQPFGNTLVVMDLTGAQIVRALENGATRLGLLAVSEGTSYSVSRSAPEGSRVRDVRIAGAPVDPAKVYRVVFNNFNANGGDGQAVLAESTGFRRDTGVVDVDALIEHLKALGPVESAPTGRVKAS